MTWVDYIVIAMLVAFFIKGYKNGFIGMIGWLIGLFLGIYLAGQNYMQAADWLSRYFDNQFTAAAVGFIAVLILVMVVVSSLFWVVNKIFHFIPVFGFFNRLLGGLLGLVEAVIILGLAFWIVSALPFTNSFTTAVHSAQTKEPVIEATGVVRQLLPASLHALANFGQSLNGNQINFDLLDPSTLSWDDIKNIDVSKLPKTIADDLADRLTPEQLKELRDKLEEQRSEIPVD